MTMRTLAPIVALAAIACGGNETKPAQEPVANYSFESPASPTTAPVAPVTRPTQTPNTPTAAVATPTRMAPGERTPEAVAPPPAMSPPAATTNDSTNADNTKKNERDRGGSTLTPMDQGNSASETKITAAIRRGIVADKNLSFTAKNVKVITMGTKVTLRGPVKSDQEKAAIESLARKAAGVSEVDNQLEIKK